VIVRPLTLTDYVRWFDDPPPSECRVWGKTVEQDQKLYGIAGVVMVAANHWGFFDIADELRTGHRFFLYRQTVQGMQEWVTRGGGVLRILCDPAVPRSRAWARRLGFVPNNDDNEDGVWTWRPQ
jgi:hypothetical protein